MHKTLFFFKKNFKIILVSFLHISSIAILTVTYSTLKDKIVNDRDIISSLENEIVSINENTFIELSLLNNKYEVLQTNTEVIESRIDILDKTVDIGSKRQAKIDLVVLAIKKTLPGIDNPLEGCKAKPSQGEMRRIAGSVVRYSEDYAISPSLILAIIRQESIFCNAAISRTGAKGYMQLMPKTAVEVAMDVGAPLKTWRGRDNIHMGTVYIGTLLAEFNGNVDLAIRAYNGGPGHVKRVLSGRTKQKICENGYETKFYCETEQYADKVSKYKDIYQKLGLM